MSTALLKYPSPTTNGPIRRDSLLEHLYTNFSLTLLRKLRDGTPDADTLKLWNVSPEEYKAEVIKAIRYVIND